MKKTLLSICIIILFLSLGLMPANAFLIEANRKQSISQENCPKCTKDPFLTVDLGTYIIKMKESGEANHVNDYPFTFDVDTSGLLEPTVKLDAILPPKILQPEIEIVVIENRPVHPEYLIIIAFYPSGGDDKDWWIRLKITVDEDQTGEFVKTIGISNTTEGFFTWTDNKYRPKIEIYRDYYDPVFKTTFLREDRTEFTVDYAKSRQKEIRHIWPSSFLNLLKSIFQK
jgi:hypothetical protein